MKRSLLSIIENQRNELNRLLTIDVLPRRPMMRIDVGSPLAQAVIGMRRSGKSVVCRQALLKSGVAFGYVDFDDESLAKISAESLDEHGRARNRRGTWLEARERRLSRAASAAH